MRALFLLIVVGALAAAAYYYFGDHLPKPEESPTTQAATSTPNDKETSSPKVSTPTAVTTSLPAAATPAKPRVVHDEYPYLVVNGQVFEKVVVTAVYPDGVSISHREGIVRIDAEDLKPALQAKYGFTATSPASSQAASAPASQP